jgi:hypothetical protein
MSERLMVIVILMSHVLISKSGTGRCREQKKAGIPVSWDPGL